MFLLPRKTIFTLAAFVFLMLLLPYAPGFAWFRSPLARLLVVDVVVHPPVAAPTPEPGSAPADPAPVTPEVKEKLPLIPPRPIAPSTFDQAALFLDPSGAMHPFYESLLRTETRQDHAITRALHYGDSPTTADSVTADVRALLQSRFGDAGHGFVLVSQPWKWYGHRGIALKASGWRHEPASQDRAEDFLHGVGGVNLTGSAGATSLIRLPDNLHRRVEVLYLRQPNGGVFRVMVDDTILAEVDTAAEEKSSGFAAAILPQGTQAVRLTVTRGTVRLFGVTFEKDGPGIIYHSLGLNGASIQHLLRYFEPIHWREQLLHQKPDLIVLNYGANESFFGSYVDSSYGNELRTVLGRLREALPKTSILVMSPMDRAEKNERGEIATPAVLERLIAIQRRIALESGCAFFNTYQSMGGAGTMARWYMEKPRLVTADFLHPLPGGAAKVGALFEKALVVDYQSWKSRRQP